MYLYGFCITWSSAELLCSSKADSLKFWRQNTSQRQCHSREHGKASNTETGIDHIDRGSLVRTIALCTIILKLSSRLSLIGQQEYAFHNVVLVWLCSPTWSNAVVL